MPFNHFSQSLQRQREKPLWMKMYRIRKRLASGTRDDISMPYYYGAFFHVVVRMLYRIALSMLRFYKTAISPILPPSCRFVPTCSSYAMEAYTEYGVGKGTIMTAWRLLRCTPWGDSGYDPAVWPPRGLEWMTSFLK